MNAAIWRSLLWKEWREHRWKLAALVTIAVGTPALAAISAGDDHPIGAVVTALMLCIFLVLPLGGVFVAMGLAASERSGGTLPFIQGMPLPMPRLAITKLVTGTVTAWLPQLIIIGLAVALVVVGRQFDWYDEDAFFEAVVPFQLLGPLFDAPLAALLTTISLLLWTAAPSVNSASEVRAGAIGLAAIAGAWTLTFGVLTVLGAFGTGSWIDDYRCLAAALPGGVMTLVEQSPSRRLPFTAIIGPYLMTHIPLAWWYVTRFGQQPTSADRVQGPAREGWLGVPFASRLSALAWKQRRECMPVVIAAAACAVGIVIFTVASNVFTAAPVLSDSPRWIGMGIVATFGFFGAVAGLVAGVGTSVIELEPKLSTFWRSRPIDIDQWFWTAFVAGLTILCVMFAAPVAIGAYLIGPTEELSGALIAAAAAPAAYSAGWLAGSVMRHAVYASLIGIGLLILAMWTGDIILDWVGAEDHLKVIATGSSMLVSAIIMSVAAWVCVRNDWSLRLS